MITIGEIRQFAHTPNEFLWLPCSGQRLMVDEHRALYQVIGNIHGGNPGQDFTIPDYNGDINPSSKPYYYIAIAGTYLPENKLVGPLIRRRNRANSQIQ